MIKKTMPELVELVGKVVAELGDWDANMRDPMHPVDLASHLTSVVDVVCATLAVVGDTPS